MRKVTNCNRREKLSGFRKCLSCAKRHPLSTRSRKHITCPSCLRERAIKRSTVSGFRLCRSCAAKQTSAVSNSPSAVQKRFETIKRNGKLWSSNPENRLFELLVERFSNDDVIHHVSINGFRIDFYVKSIHTYVQLDGTYWHGLNVPYEQLVGVPKEKFDRDRICDLYFKSQNLKLVRITDVELKENERKALNRVRQSFHSQSK